MVTLMVLCDIACQNTEANVQSVKCYWRNIALSKLGPVLSFDLCIGPTTNFLIQNFQAES